MQNQISVLFPVDEPAKSGWYACKIYFDGSKVKRIDLLLAMRVTDFHPDHVKCHEMRWLNGVPKAARNACVIFVFANSDLQRLRYSARR